MSLPKCELANSLTEIVKVHVFPFNHCFPSLSHRPRRSGIEEDMELMTDAFLTTAIVGAVAVDGGLGREET